MLENQNINEQNLKQSQEEFNNEVLQNNSLKDNKDFNQDRIDGHTQDFQRLNSQEDLANINENKNDVAHNDVFDDVDSNQNNESIEIQEVSEEQEQALQEQIAHNKKDPKNKKIKGILFKIKEKYQNLFVSKVRKNLYSTSVFESVQDASSIFKMERKIGDYLILIAGFFFIISLVEFILILILFPLKEKEPYLVTFTNDTQSFAIIQKADQSITANEALNRQLLGAYILNRETINRIDDKQRSDMVKEQSSSQVWNVFERIIAQEDSIYSNQSLTRVVKIVNIAIIKKGYANADVAISLYYNGILKSEKRYRIVISYKFNTVAIDYNSLPKNPTGFMVTGYAITEIATIKELPDENKVKQSRSRIKYAKDKNQNDILNEDYFYEDEKNNSNQEKLDSHNSNSSNKLENPNENNLEQSFKEDGSKDLNNPFNPNQDSSNENSSNQSNNPNLTNPNNLDNPNKTNHSQNTNLNNTSHTQTNQNNANSPNDSQSLKDKKKEINEQINQLQTILNQSKKNISEEEASNLQREILDLKIQEQLLESKYNTPSSDTPSNNPNHFDNSNNSNPDTSNPPNNNSQNIQIKQAVPKNSNSNVSNPTQNNSQNIQESNTKTNTQPENNIKPNTDSTNTQKSQPSKTPNDLPSPFSRVEIKNPKKG